MSGNFKSIQQAEELTVFRIVFCFLQRTCDVHINISCCFQELVHEKQNRLKESMKMMGLANWIHWSAWFTKNLLFLLIAIIIVTAMLKVRKDYSLSLVGISGHISQPAVQAYFVGKASYFSVIGLQTALQCDQRLFLKIKGDPSTHCII